jgi:hypothetical protein
MGYTVTVQQVRPQWIAAARGAYKQGGVSATMLGLLGVAWDFIKRSGVKSDGQNVAIYRPECIEAGARVFEKFEARARFRASRRRRVRRRWWFIWGLMNGWARCIRRFAIGALRMDAKWKAPTGKFMGTTKRTRRGAGRTFSIYCGDAQRTRWPGIAAPNHSNLSSKTRQE